MLVEKDFRLGGCGALEQALHIASGIYPKNRVKDMLSSTNKTGFRMTISPGGFPLSICMCADLTFALFGSRYLPDDVYLRTLLGHLDAMPRNMRRNGRFFINEDLLAGADRVLTQVMYPIWIWELYLATGEPDILRRHSEPLLRCLSFIENRTDNAGLVNQVDHDDWQLSEGADWVDWCPERMEGSTCVFHTWYARALSHCVQIFQQLGDTERAAVMRERFERQRAALDTHFWNGHAYYDNVNFDGKKVDNFWCDSQIWPIAFGYASEEQWTAILGRIDAQPEIFEGVPLRWCAPVPKEKEERRYPEFTEPFLRPLSWFGRLGAGDILGRLRIGQVSHAYKLACRYAEVVVKHGTCPEALDMAGNAQQGTGGGNDYLEHAGGFIYAAGRGLAGISDVDDGTLTWEPRLSEAVSELSLPYWHRGHCWRFGFENGRYWVDPGSGEGTVRVKLPARGQVDIRCSRRTVVG